MTTRTVWCQWAIVEDTARPGVVLQIRDGRFAEITTGVDEPPPGASVRHGVSLAGLANAHSHVFHRALRHRTHGGRGSFWTWREQMYRVADALTPDLLYRLARATFAEMVHSGVTCVGEFHYLHHPPAMHDAVLRGATDAGLRITMLDTLYLHGGLGPSGYQPIAAEQARFTDGSFGHWATRVEAYHLEPGQRLGVAVHSVRAVDPEAIVAAARWATDRDLVLHAHVSEQPAENDSCAAAHGCTPTELFERCGAITDRFTAVHATHLTAHDIAVLGAAGATACFCPSTEADLADGTGPASALVAGGARLAVGSDSQAIIDLLAEARAVEMDQRRVSGSRGHFTAAELLGIATTAGHRSLGWPDAGLLAPGYRADVVTVDIGSPRTAGAAPDHLLEMVTFAATAADVSAVTVDGVDVFDRTAGLGLDVGSEIAAVIDEIDTHCRRAAR